MGPRGVATQGIDVFCSDGPKTAFVPRRRSSRVMSLATITHVPVEMAGVFLSVEPFLSGDMTKGGALRVRHSAYVDFPTSNSGVLILIHQSHRTNGDSGDLKS